MAIVGLTISLGINLGLSNQVKDLKSQVKFENGLSSYVEELNSELPDPNDVFQQKETSSTIYDSNVEEINKVYGDDPRIYGVNVPEPVCSRIGDSIELRSVVQAQSSDYTKQIFCITSEGVFVEGENVQNGIAIGFYSKAYLSTKFTDLYKELIEYVKKSDIKPNGNSIDIKSLFGTCYISDSIVLTSLEGNTIEGLRASSCFSSSSDEYETNLSGDFAGLINLLKVRLSEKGVKSDDLFSDLVYPDLF